MLGPITPLGVFLHFEYERVRLDEDLIVFRIFGLLFLFCFSVSVQQFVLFRKHFMK